MNPCASFCSFPSVKWCVIFSPMAITAVHKRPVKQAKLNGHWWNEPLWLGPAARLFLSWLNHGGRRRWLLRRRLLSHQIGHCNKKSSVSYPISNGIHPVTIVTSDLSATCHLFGCHSPCQDAAASHVSLWSDTNPVNSEPQDWTLLLMPCYVNHYRPGLL